MRFLAPLLVISASSLLAACGGGTTDKQDVSANASSSGSPASTAAAPASGGPAGPACLSTADVESALGFAVNDLTRGMRQYGPMWTCGFVAADTARLPGVTVTITIEPASEAEQRFAEMREASQM